MNIHLIISCLYAAILLQHTNASATIYGDNSLLEVSSSKDPKVHFYSQSIATEFLNFQLKNIDSEGRVQISHQTLRNKSICEGEPYLDQTSGGRCTGFLVGPDLLVTANHCMGGGLNCKTAQWVFDYYLPLNPEEEITIPLSSIYTCTEVIASSYANHLDYALVRLSRPVDGRPLFKFNPRKVKVGEKVASISSPFGMPLKYSEGVVRDVSPENYIETNLDLMRGSSGAPVLDAKTFEVLGIVAQGEKDLQAGSDPKEICNEFKRCADSECRGEYATRVSRLPF